MKRKGDQSNQNQKPLLRAQRRVWASQLDEEQKDQLAESKWTIVIAATVVVFFATGGWRLFIASAIHHHFADMSTGGMQQTHVWIMFLLTFGILGGLITPVLLTVVLNYLTHSKGSRR